MNLPHAEPLIFAKEILSRNSSTVQVRCEFNTLPTLAMFIEAAAQSSAAFNFDSETKVKIGFLTTAKNVQLLNEIKKKNCLINVELETEINNIKQFYFKVQDDDNGTEYASGYFTLFMQEG